MPPWYSPPAANQHANHQLEIHGRACLHPGNDEAEVHTNPEVCLWPVGDTLEERVEAQPGERKTGKYMKRIVCEVAYSGSI